MSSLPDAAVREMIERVIELSRSYAIWWTLVDKSNFNRYANVIDNHRDFFEATIHSLFQGFSVITYQLFEKRRDTTSIPSIIDSLASSNAGLHRKLVAEIDVKRPLLKKVFSIRGNVYAHRNKSRPPEDFFADAVLTPNEMKTVVRFAQDIVATLGAVAGVDTKNELDEEIRRREDFAAEDTRLIMETLDKHAL